MIIPAYPPSLPLPAIKPEHLEPAVDALIASGRAKIEDVLAKGDFSWDGLVEPLIEENERLSNAFGPAGYLNAVCQTGELRNAYNACLPKLSEYGTQAGKNQALAYQVAAI